MAEPLQSPYVTTSRQESFLSGAEGLSLAHQAQVGAPRQRTGGVAISDPSTRSG